MSSCIIPGKLEEYRKAIKDRKLDIISLMKMPDSASRIEAFRPFAGSNAEKLNELFEEKLILKNRMQGLKNFVSKTAEVGKYSEAGKIKVAQEMSEYKAMQQERILNPKENETYLNSLADKMVGTHIEKDVANKIFELSANVEKAKEAEPTALGVSDEYFKSKDALNNYVESQKPIDVKSSILNNLAIIGRNNLIMGISTPVKTSIGQAVNSTLDMITRRLGTGEFAGANPEIKNDLFKQVQKTFAETGRNGLGMESLDDAHFLGFGKKAEDFGLPKGGKISGKDLTLAEKIDKGVEKTAEISNYIAITLEHQVPFTKFYQKAWLDMGDLMSTQMAKMEGAKDVKGRAGELLTDAARIEPQTAEGAMLRLECQKQAARVTSTNENTLANISLTVKKALNRIIPMGEGKYFPLGNFIEPMAKIPATVISNSIENAGGGIPFGLRDIWQGKVKIQSEDPSIRLEGLAQFGNGIQKLARIGGSIGIAALMVNSIDKKDLREDKWGNRFFRIGNMWVNTEYLSFVSAAMGGMIEMKAGKDQSIEGKAGEYVAGALKGLKSTPGIDELSKLRDALTNSNLVKGIKRYASDFFTSRGTPQALRAVAKGKVDFPWVGPNDRPVDRLFFGAHGVESTQDVAEDKREQKQNAKERRLEAKRDK